MLGHFTHDFIHNNTHTAVTITLIGLGIGAALLAGKAIKGKLAKKKKASK